MKTAESEDYLYRLVHSLTQNEKRHLRLLATTFQKIDKPKHLILMDALLRMEDYSEEGLRKKLRGAVILKHLPVEKNNLYKFILKGLKIYHSEGKSDVILADGLMHARIVSEKGFYAQAIKLIEAERKEAEQFGKYAFLLEAVRLQKWILIDKAYGDPHVKLPILQKLELSYLQSYSKQIQIQQLREKTHQLLVSEYGGRNQKTVEQAEKLILELNDIAVESLSFLALNDYHWCYIYFASLCKKQDIIHKHFKQLIDAWRQNESWRLREAGEYKKLLSNYLSYCHEYDVFDEFEDILKELKELPVFTQEEEASLFKNISMFELLYYINLRKWGQGEQLIPYIEDGLSRYGKHIRESRELAIYYNIFTLYFFQSKYKQSLQWLMRILNYKRTGFREDIQRAARLIQLILLYELKNHEVFEDYMRATHVYLQRKNALFSFEELTLFYLKKLQRTNDSKSEKNLLNDFMNGINNSVMQLVPVPLGTNEVYYWIKSRLENKSIQDLLD